MTDLEQRATEYRALRSSIETAVLPLATSVDGRTFAFQASLHGLEFRVGGYVMLEDAAGQRSGQVHSLGLVSEEAAAVEHTEADTRTQSRVFVRLARGAGAILDGDGRPFHDALARPATPAEVDEWLARTAPRGAQLEVGELALAPGVPCRLNAEGFARHTFLCGQSGSGKTYALGVVLERLLLETDLRIVILDPNSDFVGLGEPAGDDPRYREVAGAVRVVRAPSQGDGEPLGV